MFGAGEIGKKSISLLEKNYNILFLADNDEKKWETIYSNYTVKAPEEIRKYDCNIAITSARYGIGIAKQLKQMGVSQDRIYFFRVSLAGDEYGYDLYPLLENKVQSTTLQLVQYDLYHEKEIVTNNKKVLIFCTFYSTYTKQLIENISKRCDDVEFSLLTNAAEYKEKIVSEKLMHIYCFKTMADLKTILEQLPVYDAMQLLWIEREWAYFYYLIRKKTRRLNLNVGGSDFYRTDKEERDYKRKLIACADGITAETEATVQEFGEYYYEETKNKLKLLPFGVEVLDHINYSENANKNYIKEKNHIPLNKIVVTCGHNAIQEHQHLKMIDALNKLPESIKKQIVCVFPMTYPQGRETYINSVEYALKESNLEYIILTEFMDFQKMAEYALISDIMLHVQRTDQLSSTMLEEMYAGSIVIAGKWLPYQSLHEIGIFFIDAEAISDISTLLADVVINIENYKKKCVENKRIIWKHSSWDELTPRWRLLWN